MYVLFDLVAWLVSWISWWLKSPIFEMFSSHFFISMPSRINTTPFRNNSKNADFSLWSKHYCFSKLQVFVFTTAVQHHHKTSSQKNHFISCHARKLNINILIGMRVIKGVYQLSRLCRHLVTLHHFNAVMHEYKKIFINIFIVEIVKHGSLASKKSLQSN